MSAAVQAGYKQTEVGVIPEDWAITSLDTVAKIVDSLHQTPTFSNDGYAMVRVTDIKIGNLNLDGALKVSATVFTEFISNYAPKRSDIVLSRVGSYGVSSFVDTDEPFCMGQNTVVIQPWVPPRYLYYVLNSPGIRRQIEDGSYGSGYKSLSLKNIKELSLPIPHADEEQRAIATALSDVDALLAKLDALVAKKRDLKVATMQQLLTGQTRLPGFSGEWEVKRLGDISPLQRGFDLLTSRLHPGSYPVVYSNGVSSYHDEFMVKGPGVVTGRSGTIGNVHFVEGDFWPHNTSLWVTSFKGNSPKFIFYLLSSLGLDKFGTGSGVPTLNRNDVHAHKVLIPTTAAEQTAIATILSDMDAELTALEARRDKTRALKQGMMQELLTGRIRLL